MITSGSFALAATSVVSIVGGLSKVGKWRRRFRESIDVLSVITEYLLSVAGYGRFWLSLFSRQKRRIGCICDVAARQPTGKLCFDNSVAFTHSTFQPFQIENCEVGA